MRNRFDRQLEKLNDDLVLMGTMIERAIAAAVKAVTTGDMEAAKQVIAGDEEINHAEREIESLCLKLLLQQQPVAKDLRLISAALKMITDMERIGDQAADICEILLESDNLHGVKLPSHIDDMAKETIYMVNTAVEAFVNKDIEMARVVCGYDKRVDSLFAQIKADLITGIKESTHRDEEAIDILMISKYLEKIGDHAENVAEWVVFSITGEHAEER